MRSIVIRPGVDMMVADRLITKYREDEETRKDEGGFLGATHHTQYTADYGNGIKIGYWVYQTKTNIVVGKNYLQNFSVKLGEEYANTGDTTPITN